MPGCGARGRRLGLAETGSVPPDQRLLRGLRGPAAGPVGGGRARPGFETTRRAKLAARTASGRAAAHGHNQQPGPGDSTCGAQNTSGNKAPHQRAQAHKKPTSGSDVGLWWS